MYCCVLCDICREAAHSQFASVELGQSFRVLVLGFNLRVFPAMIQIRNAIILKINMIYIS